MTEIDDHDDPEFANGKYIFLLDRSGSMSGTRIEVAKEALCLFLRSIPPNSRFNVVSFGDRFEKMYNQSVPYNNETMNDALNKISRFNADMGGTELYDAINWILTKKNERKYPRNLFVLTDGGIFDTQKVLEKIRECNNYSRVHSFGIGSGASAYLVKEMAKEGKGSSTIIGDRDPHLKTKVIRALKLASKPAYTNTRIDWGENRQNVKFYVPHTPYIPNIYEEEPFNIYAILSENDFEDGNITLKFFNTYS